MDAATTEIDVTTEEGAIISAYAGQRIKRSIHKQPMMDSVIYWRCEWMRPQPPGCKQNAYENYRLALEAWREERAKTMTTTPVQPQQKSAALEAVEQLSERVDRLMREQYEADHEIITTIREMRSEIGIIHGVLTDLQAAMQKHAAPPVSVPVAPVKSDNGAQYTTFHCDSIVMTYNDDGKPAYKAKGGRFSTYGVTIWPEVLPKLGIDPDKLKPGPNAFNIEVKAEIETKQGDDGQPHTKAKKVVGLA